MQARIQPVDGPFDLRVTAYILVGARYRSSASSCVGVRRKSAAGFRETSLFRKIDQSSHRKCLFVSISNPTLEASNTLPIAFCEELTI